MNRKQLTVLWVAVAIIVAMAVVPPWAEVVTLRGLGSKDPCCYAPIWDPPATSDVRYRGYSIDWSRLALEWVVIVVIAGAGIATLGGGKREKPAVAADEKGWDPLLREAANACIQNGGGSAWILQRRLAVGHGRAASILGQLQEARVLVSCNSE